MYKYLFGIIETTKETNFPTECWFLTLQAHHIGKFIAHTQTLFSLLRIHFNQLVPVGFNIGTYHIFFELSRNLADCAAIPAPTAAPARTTKDGGGAGETGAGLEESSQRIQEPRTH